MALGTRVLSDPLGSSGESLLQFGQEPVDTLLRRCRLTGLPAPAIITGRYHDTFVRDGQNWHFRAGASSPIKSDPWDTTS